jgi:hypothetical protein
MQSTVPSEARAVIATVATIGFALSSPLAHAGDVVVRATGTVSQVSMPPPASGPFVSVQVGDPVEMHLEVASVSIPLAHPGRGAYLLDAPVSTFGIGAASDVFSSATASYLNVWDEYAGIRDEVLFVTRRLAQGDLVTLALLDTTRSVFHTHDILELRGDYPAPVWSTRTFYLQAGGGQIEFELTQFEIGAFGPGVIICAPAIPNSTGRDAQINATGTAGAAANDLGLQARRLPANTFGFFITSRTQASVLNPGGSEGRLCLGGAIGRYQNQVQNSGATGQIGIALNTFALPTPTGPVAAGVGETWTFQAWYRDANPASTSNFTDAVAVTFE